ncbi:unnamed protein product [Cladocopium goreaui]|uniref:Mitochondrial import inner membrane translocase subunit TIM44 (Inner membrane import site protein 45) (ISP45) (Membrane import machinery protein MIM44) (Mitochondrial protein import protein 1) n=1 Tax=Cladocopium goreaui TaxID=2562237 RepID=A0A9P1FFC4_9DINO|nr:unnamed protein product [Cladocopium goreaui]
MYIHGLQYTTYFLGCTSDHWAFWQDLEYIVVPHIIKSYLEGDQEALQKHCGDACFNSVNAGIKERKKLQMTLDTKILSGPREVELKGAKLMEQGAPCFIWTFNMQQVNCLRDKEGEIIEGAVDDIRTVCYAMAVTRHPQLDKLDLEYPWQVSELAILWNQPGPRNDTGRSAEIAVSWVIHDDWMI